MASARQGRGTWMTTRVGGKGSGCVFADSIVFRDEAARCLDSCVDQIQHTRKGLTPLCHHLGSNTSKGRCKTSKCTNKPYQWAKIPVNQILDDSELNMFRFGKKVKSMINGDD